MRWPQGAVQYGSARRTLIAITNRNPNPSPRAKDPKIPFNRYFRVGRYSELPPSQDIFSLFSPVSTQIVVSRPKGIDLAKRGHEVRKLFYAGFAHRIIAMGYDPEDMLQELYRGLLVRNNGKCPFDAEKSTFGHYVHMVCECLIRNYAKRWGRVYGAEQYGVKSKNGEIIDVGSSEVICSKTTPEYSSGVAMALRAVSDEAVSSAYEFGADPDLVVKCVKALASGMRRADLENEFSPSHRPFQIDKAYRAARSAAQKVLSA